VGSLTPAEAALLAGMIRGPNLYSPYKYPSRALERRNFVLRSMMELDMLTPKETEKASAAPLGVVLRNVEGTEAPYFVDMVKDQLLDAIHRARPALPELPHLHHPRFGCAGSGFGGSPDQCRRLGS
jgi:membrane peptidoglycan carboxypeptidase